MYGMCQLVLGIPLSEIRGLAEEKTERLSMTRRAYRDTMQQPMEYMFVALLDQPNNGYFRVDSNFGLVSSSNKEPESGLSPLGDDWYCFERQFVSYFFEDFELSVSWGKRCIGYLISNSPNADAISVSFLAASGMIALWKQQRQKGLRRNARNAQPSPDGNRQQNNDERRPRKHTWLLRKSRRILRQIEKTSVNLPDFSLGKIHLLKADLIATRAGRKNRRAMHAFKTAIATTAQSGIIYEQAIANERTGRFLIDVCEDPSRGITYLEEAGRLYAAWGAEWKSNRMLTEVAEWST